MYNILFAALSINDTAGKSMNQSDFIEFQDDGPDAVFSQAMANGEFRIQQCQGCDKHIFYPRIVCPHCGSNNLAWVTPSGKATVYSTSIPRQKPEQGGSYNISLVDLAEGPRLMSRVVDIDPEEVKIGMAVTAFVSEIDGVPVVLFRPDSSTAEGA